ncbi:hypothetical protein BJ508DRAFT_131327 [Ascobolus immersus RN42]|uniref:Uncharacterized protein n=1 Tax=Ascobolus immersus RN42 TaxID=1160509 RepID=A0A3N4I260_ASCIM|nr:hypothetical protein BJ508DRAFT_131327 [Ascobolus immersus RN42]
MGWTKKGQRLPRARVETNLRTGGPAGRVFQKLLKLFLAFGFQRICWAGCFRVAHDSRAWSEQISPSTSTIGWDGRFDTRLTCKSRSCRGFGPAYVPLSESLVSE